MRSQGGSAIVRLIALVLIVCTCAGCRKPSQSRKRSEGTGKQSASSATEIGTGTKSGGQGQKPGGQGQGSGGSRGSNGASSGSSSGNDQSGNGSGRGDNRGGSGSGNGQPGDGVQGGQSQGRRPGSGADRSESDAIGVVPPKSSSEAADAAQGELKKSKDALDRGDLPGAYRHAALALQSAEYFPDDPACSRLALSARAQLQLLEKRGVSMEDLQKKGNVQGKRIIETP